ncbi:MAG: tetratricopeptide repeat protein [Mariprofundaceae bacterium]|nr:tetratricopeptide repeat protein [Mariprofundaceae bacterium]
MTQKNPTLPEKEYPTSQFDEEMAELKKDMKSAKLVDWLQSNQQMLMVAGLLLLMAMFAGGLWSEQQKTKKEAAAMLYYQGISLQNKDKQKALLEQVKRDYADTAYATLATMHLANLSDTEKNLRELMENKEVNPEFRWQARLDLAEYLIQQGKKDAAKLVLNGHVGREYEQLRYALIAAISEGDAKKTALQKSLDAPSHDEVLKEKVMSELAQLH